LKAAFRNDYEYHKKLLAAISFRTSFTEAFNALTKTIFDIMGVPEHKRASRFFDITGLTAKQYYEMKNAAPEYFPNDRRIVAICAGFDLDISVCETLFAAGNRRLGYTDEHWAFRLILTKHRGLSIYERNAYLESVGFGKLTDD
jgi:transposase